METTIKGTPKEIADLVLELQNRQDVEKTINEITAGLEKARAEAEKKVKKMDKEIIRQHPCKVKLHKCRLSKEDKEQTTIRLPQDLKEESQQQADRMRVRINHCEYRFWLGIKSILC